MFRLVSGFLPRWSHAGTKHLYADADLRGLIERRLASAGAFARANGVRLSMHPAQHVILATLREAALANALLDIGEHVDIMQMMGFGGGWHPHGAHVNIHGEYLQPDDPRVERLKQSWRGVRPAAHISVSRESLYSELLDRERPDFAELSAAGFKASELRGHSDMMWNMAVNDLVAAHLSWCDVEVEAKSKNLASA